MLGGKIFWVSKIRGSKKRGSVDSNEMNVKFPTLEGTEDNCPHKYWEREEMEFPPMDPRCRCLEDYGEVMPSFEDFCDMNKKRGK
jgi:hypothetical protein